MKRTLLSFFIATIMIWWSSSVAGEILYRQVSLYENALLTTSNTSGTSTFAEATPKGTTVACRANATNVSGTSPTLDIKVKTCTDKEGTDCDALCVFDRCETGQCWGDGSQVIDLPPGANVFPYFLVENTLGGNSPVYSVNVSVHY